EGEKFIDLGKNKRATVRRFKGTTLIDIREFYLDKASGEQKPGKKGISLGLDQVSIRYITYLLLNVAQQWTELQRVAPTLDKLAKEMK
ncbi:transcriptional Coactivator p15-domain-containing protein, partial [Mycena rosella]